MNCITCSNQNELSAYMGPVIIDGKEIPGSFSAQNFKYVCELCGEEYLSQEQADKLLKKAITIYKIWENKKKR